MATRTVDTVATRFWELPDRVRLALICCCYAVIALGFVQFAGLENGSLGGFTGLERVSVLG